MENVRHRPGAFKQQNKAHKTGRHRSKGQIDNTNKGKVEVKALTKHRKQQSRDDRKNRLNQLRKTKREEILNKKRLIGGLNGAPHIVVLISNFTFYLSSLFHSFPLYFQVHFASLKRRELR
jgi:pre-rRNA-processing protein TSR1